MQCNEDLISFFVRGRFRAKLFCFRDKDHLWKEGELLRDRLDDQVDVMEEISWVDDDDVSHCTACGSQFTVTLRKHHCRLGNEFLPRIYCRLSLFLSILEIAGKYFVIAAVQTGN